MSTIRYGAHFRMMKIFWGIRYDDGCTIYDYTKTTEFYTLKRWILCYINYIFLKGQGVSFSLSFAIGIKKLYLSLIVTYFLKKEKLVNKKENLNT